MRDGSTEIGAPGAQFATTRWSLVLRAKDPGAADSRENLDILIRTYWRPVYGYLRHRWGMANEDAKDATQAFFADLLERPFLSAVGPEKGSFRTFLLACLRNFLHNRHDAEQAQKRGGGRAILSLDFITADGRDVGAADAPSPEEAFARAWEQAVLREAIQRLRALYAAEKREAYFAAFEAYDLSGDREVSYPAVARRLGISETDVTNYLAHSRRRFRTVVQEVVRDSVSDESQLPGEMETLFGSAA